MAARRADQVSDKNQLIISVGHDLRCANHSIIKPEIEEEVAKELSIKTRSKLEDRTKVRFEMQ